MRSSPSSLFLVGKGVFEVIEWRIDNTWEVLKSAERENTKLERR